jgi:hypothetical protein
VGNHQSVVKVLIKQIFLKILSQKIVMEKSLFDVISLYFWYLFGLQKPEILLGTFKFGTLISIEILPKKGYNLNL